MIDKTTATRRERCDTSDAWNMIREMTRHIPEVSAFQRQRVRTHQAAARLIPAAVRCKARLDAYLGRVPPDEAITVKSCLESIAEIVELEANRPAHLCWSDHSIVMEYRAELARQPTLTVFPADYGESYQPGATAP